MQTITTLILSLLSLVISPAIEAQVKAELRSELPDQGRDDAVGFAIGNTGYILGGRKSDFGISPDLWAYDVFTDTWMKKAPLPATPRQYSSTFVVEGLAYVMGGNSGSAGNHDEVWAYDAAADSWTQKSDFPGGARFAAVAFCLEGIGYYGLGRDTDTVYADVWSYSSASDTWEHAFDLPSPRYSAIAAPRAESILLGLGIDDTETYRSELWTYSSLGLEQQAPFLFPLAFSDAMQLGDELVLVGGLTASGELIDQYYVLDQELNADGSSTWLWNASTFPLGDMRNGTTFSFANFGYYFGGKNEMQEKSNGLTLFTSSIDKKGASIYPQPAQDYLRVETLSPFSEVSLIDSRGREVASFGASHPTRHARIDLRQSASGVYLLMLDGRRGQRVIVD